MTPQESFALYCVLFGIVLCIAITKAMKRFYRQQRDEEIRWSYMTQPKSTHLWLVKETEQLPTYRREGDL